MVDPIGILEQVMLCSCLVFKVILMMLLILMTSIMFLVLLEQLVCLSINLMSLAMAPMYLAPRRVVMYSSLPRYVILWVIHYPIHFPISILGILLLPSTQD